jgi:phosphonopyruvate decarboxylase
VTVDPAAFSEALAAEGVEFFSGVPDSLLKELCAFIAANTDPDAHVIAANEGTALAICAGYHLATGQVGAVYLQNAGLGNLVNPLLSLADRSVYGIPMVVIVGWRGEPGTVDEPQHMQQGRVTPTLLDAMGYPHRVVRPDPGDATEDVAWAVGTARAESSPVFLLVSKDTFSPSPRSEDARPESSLARETAIEVLIEQIGTRATIVASTGMIGRELAEVRERRGEDPAVDFLSVGSMGHASSIALGIALARPDRRVICLDGDGAMLMHLGAVAVNGQTAPENFAHVVLNNGAHDSVGGQPTVGLDIDLGAIAKACGYHFLGTVTSRDELGEIGERLVESPGPVMAEVRVRRGARADLGRPKAAPVESKRRFMEALESTRPSPSKTG